MAVQTVIFRPTSGFFNNGSTKVRYPTETANELVYLLVAEEIADDDASYYGITGGLPSDGVSFSVQDEHKDLTPTAIRVVARIKGAYSDTNAIVIYGMISSKTEFVRISENIPMTYTNYVFPIGDEYRNAFWETICAGSSTRNSHISIGSSRTGESAKSTTYAYVTQIYLEVDFEVDDPTPSGSGVYVKKNGSFIEATQMFHKVSGTWIEITADECKNLLLST